MLTIRPEAAASLARAGLDSFDALMTVERGCTLHKRRLAGWRQRIALDVDGDRLYLKRYLGPPPAEQVVQRVRGFASTAEVEQHWLGELERLGIPAPRVMACGHRRLGPWERSSLILTAAVAGEALERLVPAELDGSLRCRRLRLRLLLELADLVGRLHGADLFHRDLYLSHIFLDVHDAQPTLSLIDLQRMIRPRLRRRRWMVKDLAALNYSTPAGAATTADRVRWFKRYRCVRTLGAADRAVIRAIVARTARIARHSRKHGLGVCVAESPSP